MPHTRSTHETQREFRRRIGCRALRQRSSHGTRFRSGYSLIELLVVVAVVVLLAGLTIPAMRRPLDRSRLRGAGRTLQTHLAKTRSLAIRTGQDHWLRYELSGRSWRIETRAEIDRGTSDPETNDPLRADPAEPLLTDNDAAPEPQISIVREGDLPEGVRFAAPNADESTDFETDPPTESEPDVVATVHWSEPIRFRPNGRSTTTIITIAGARDFVTEVRLRGLTGLSVAETFRPRPTTHTLEGLPTAEFPE